MRVIIALLAAVVALVAMLLFAWPKPQLTEQQREKARLW